MAVDGVPVAGMLPMAHQLGRLQFESAMFWGRRWRAMAEAMGRAGTCRTPLDVWQLQLAQLIDFVLDTQRTMQRLGQTPNDRR
jgi:hypothetical protein